MKYVLMLILGVILGAVAAIYFLGTPRAHKLPGTVVQAPPPGGDAPGTLVLAMDDKFFAEVLGSVFNDLGSPSFQLSSEAEAASPMRTVAFQGGCTNSV